MRAAWQSTTIQHKLSNMANEAAKAKKNKAKSERSLDTAYDMQLALKVLIIMQHLHDSGHSML